MQQVGGTAGNTTYARLAKRIVAILVAMCCKMQQLSIMFGSCKMYTKAFSVYHSVYIFGGGDLLVPAANTAMLAAHKC